MLDNDAPRNEYTATSGQTTFAYTFRIYSINDIKAYATASGADANDAADEISILSVSNIDSNDGGNVVVAAQTAGTKITLVQSLEYERLSDYITSGDFSPTNVNKELDRIISLIKQVADERRGLQFERCQQGVTDAILDPPAANAFLRWNPTGTRIINTTLSASASGTVVSVSGDGVDNTDPDNPVITSVVTVTGDQVLNTDDANPKVLPQIIYCTNSKASNTYTFTPVGTYRSLPASEANMNGVILATDIATTNTGSVTISISGMTNRLLYKDGDLLTGSEIDGFTLMRYDHTNTRWHLLFSSKSLFSGDDFVTTSDQDDGKTVWSDGGTLKVSSLAEQSDPADGITVWDDSGVLKIPTGILEAAYSTPTSDQSDGETVYLDSGALKVSTAPWNIPTADQTDGETIWYDSGSGTLKVSSSS